MTNSVSHERPVFEPSVFLSTATPTGKDRRLAVAAVLLSLLVFLAAIPFARLPLAQVWAFIPIYQSALAISSLITAILLFVQFSILRSRALLVLACGYLFTALMAVVHMLTFPGLFSPTGWLGAGPQSTAWLYMFWHGVFPIAVITYALLKGDARADSPLRSATRLDLSLGIVGVVAAVAALAALTTAGQALLPDIMRGNSYAVAMNFTVSAVWALSVVAVIVLWLRRPHTVLDLWLMVVMCAWTFDVALSAMLNAGRFDLGFYAGRIYGLLASTFVLLVLLLQTGALYARLARLLVTEQRERELETEERHRIFDNSVDLILVTDRHGNLVRVSQSSLALLGYEPEEVVGRSAAEFIYPDDLEPTRNEMRLARRGRQTRSFETRYVHKDGRVVTLAWTGAWSEPARQHLFIGRDTTEQKLAGEKLREQKVLLDAALQNMSHGLCMFDASGRIVLFNERYRAMMGLPAEFLQGLSLLDLFKYRRTTGDFVSDPEEFFADVMADVPAGKWDTKTMESQNGRTLRVVDRPMAGGGWVATFEDITEWQKAQVAIREYAEREQLFIAAVESSNDAIVTKSLDGVITGWNQAAERLFGYSSEEAIGQSIDIIVPDELRGEVRDILAKIKNGEKVDHHETIRTDKAGRQIHVSLGVSPVKSQSGVIIGAAKVARNISARKKAQEALAESERMGRAIIDTALDAFIQLDEGGTVIGWSPKAEAMFGWSREEIVGCKLSDLIVPEANRAAFSERIVQFLHGAADGNPGKRYESQSLRRDGSKLDTEVSLTALRRRDGTIINAFIRDITDKTAAEQQLRQSQKMESVGQLTGGIAHDFNNMLTVITGTIDILADAVSGKPELVAIAKLISEAADRGAELTGHLLAFARKQPLQPREIDANALMIESEKLLRRTLGEQVEINLRLEDDVWPALIDPSQLTSALLNLAVNARDAMPNGGKLTLETKNVVLDQGYARSNAEVQAGHYVMVAVSDTGDGIPEAIRQKIFEPFFTTKEVGRGTGLGLSMVYGFVKQSGGHIKVYSEEGYGTTFKLYLPRASARAEAIAEASQESVIEGGTETILIVEDDALVRGAVTTRLQNLGYQTLAAANAAEALAIADTGAQFDLLFTDVIMPGSLNGRQLAEEMAKRRPSLKVLFTSGYTENAIIHHGRLDAGVLLLAKPYRNVELARMLRSALDGTATLPRRGREPPKSQAV
jgi:PAS domain S-box-containing protein